MQHIKRGLTYDKSGNLIKPGFRFDPFDQLIHAAGEDLFYDALGRRLQKGNTSYLVFVQGVYSQFKLNRL
jgi:hypothetical protein